MVVLIAWLVGQLWCFPSWQLWWIENWLADISTVGWGRSQKLVSLIGLFLWDIGKIITNALQFVPWYVQLFMFCFFVILASFQLSYWWIQKMYLPIFVMPASMYHNDAYVTYLFTCFAGHGAILGLLWCLQLPFCQRSELTTVSNPT